jgi:hypothetical protein
MCGKRSGLRSFFATTLQWNPTGRVKDLGQSTALVHDLDDIVSSARLWVKLYAG